MKHYTAEAQRSGKWWAITILGVKGAHGQTKRLDQVRPAACEIIAMLTDQAEDEFTVDVVQEMPPEIQKKIAYYIELSNELSELQRRMTETQKFTVHELVEDGLTVRDVGTLLGLSHQRVAQVAGGASSDDRLSEAADA